jgi:hypothetical protein
MVIILIVEEEENVGERIDVSDGRLKQRSSRRACWKRFGLMIGGTEVAIGLSIPSIDDADMGVDVIVGGGVGGSRREEGGVRDKHDVGVVGGGVTILMRAGHELLERGAGEKDEGRLISSSVN